MTIYANAPNNWVANDIPLDQAQANQELREKFLEIDTAFDTVFATGITVLDREVAQIDVVNTVVETDIFNYSIGADVLSTNRAVRLTLIGNWLSQAGNPTLKIKVYLGATTMYDDTTAALNASANRAPITIDLLMGNQDSDSVQILGGNIKLGSVAAPTTGIGDLALDALKADTPMGGDAAEDSTGALVFRVTVTWSAAAATNSFQRQLAFLELI